MARINKKSDEFEVTGAEIEAKLAPEIEEKDGQTTPPAMYYLRQRKILSNLLIMMVIWLSSSFDYYLIMYLVNTFKKVYVSAVASSLSEMVAYAVSGAYYMKLGARLTFISSFGLSIVGGIIILAYGLNHQDDWSFVILVLITKFGIVPGPFL